VLWLEEAIVFLGMTIVGLLPRCSTTGFHRPQHLACPPMLTSPGRLMITVARPPSDESRLRKIAVRPQLIDEVSRVLEELSAPPSSDNPTPHRFSVEPSERLAVRRSALFACGLPGILRGHGPSAVVMVSGEMRWGA